MLQAESLKASEMGFDVTALSYDPFVEAIIQQESAGNPRARSKKGARGLMQIMPGTLQEYNQYNRTNLTPDDLYDPVINRRIGSWYINTRIPQMLEYYKQAMTPENMLWAYNAGIGNMVNRIKPPETQAYVPAVMGRFNKMPPPRRIWE